MSKRIALAFVAVAVLGAGLLFVRPPQARAGALNQPVLLIHGWNPSSIIGCDDAPMWGTVRSYFAARGYTNTKSVPFYNGDYNCSGDRLNVHDARCSGWYDSGSDDGTVNEDIRHTTCNLAWYIWDRYTVNGTYISVVAHSMGGILIRQMLNDTGSVANTFPPYLRISDIVTAGTPHQGIVSATAWIAHYGQGCPGNCLEISQLEQGNPLMSNLNSTSFRGGWGRNPYGLGGTDWTTMSSNVDDMLWAIAPLFFETMGAPSTVAAPGAIGLMPGAKHFVVYPGVLPWYGHGDYLTDTNTTWNASECYSDNNGGVWYCVSNSEHSIFTMHYGVLYSSW